MRNRSVTTLSDGILPERLLLAALILALPGLALARPEANGASRVSPRSAQAQEMRLQMREYRKNWSLPRPVTATDGMPAALAPARPTSRTRLSDSERHLLRKELREIHISPTP